ncbi:nucleoside triphosphate pyrophosphohydrolase [Christensenella sp. MSJ-20]|uniref:nucleoside triphosphate pyrophosphohydrolase n=1 Tax=Christensenella sp. MSJ-20 TaxID=2841518 RepID=UPI001C773A71|nr:nucleoside triphosphate pyrophosphohydrolase [Christensenella sp. MSJ-20]
MGITIVGMGSAQGVEPQVLERLKGCAEILLQTQAYPGFRGIQEAVGGRYLDELYESSQNFAAFNDRVVRMALEAAEKGEVALCVAGDGAGDNAAAAQLLSVARREGIAVGVLPGPSLATLALAEAGVVPERGLRVTDDLKKEGLTANSGMDLVIPEVNSPLRAGMAKLALLEAYPHDHRVYLSDPLEGNGVEEIPLVELDRPRAFTPFCTLVVPRLELREKERFAMEDLIEVCRILRSPEGCPWDREQTHDSLRRNLLEEAYEVLGAIQEGDPFHMAEEFGDLLLQIALHAIIGEEHGEYDITDVATGICQKMMRRHPHVFGDVAVSSTGEVLDNWEEIKRRERGQEGQKSYLADVGKGLPPLKMAEEIQKKAARWGFDWEDYRPAAEKVREELLELTEAFDGGRKEEALAEAGDLLFACVNVIRLMGLDGDTALFLTCEKFKSRFLAMESMAAEEGKSLKEMDLDQMDALWERAKKH